MEEYGELLDEFETPFYVTDLELVKNRYREVDEALENITVKYACKSNFDPLVLQELHNIGSEFVAGSSYEAILANEYGIRADSLQVTAVTPSKESIEHMVYLSSLNDGFTVTVNEYDTVKRLVGKGYIGDILVRLKADKELMTSTKYKNGSYLKFGMSQDEIERTLSLVEESDLNLRGFHSHLGGSINNKNIEKLRHHINYVIRRSTEYMSIGDIDVINFGGGFGIKQRPDDTELNLRKINSMMSDELIGTNQTKYVIEPGRYISGPSTSLLTEVRTIRDTDDGRFVGVDAGMSQFPRTTMFDVYHPVRNISQTGDPVEQTVAGPTCSGADIFCNNRSFGRAKKGDILSVDNVGAYGYVMSSNFHAYPYPTMVSRRGEESPLSETGVTEKH
jgi:diaminopimelate decarboxylase